MAATKSGTRTAPGRTRSSSRSRAVSSGGVRRWLRPPGGPVGLLLLVLAITLTLLAIAAIVALLSGSDARSNDAEVPATAAPREINREELLAARRLATCGDYRELAKAHALALDAPADERLDRLAALDATLITDPSSPLAEALAHRQAAIRHDLAAEAWAAVGDTERALVAFRLAEGEVLQSEAFAGAACAS